MPQKIVSVPNISCQHCVATIERELGDLQGVESVSADQASQEVTVEWTAAGTDWQSIASFLGDIGYPPAEEG